MKIAFLNCQRGLPFKIDTIEAYLHHENVSVLGLEEIDLKPFEVPPTIKGYSCITSAIKDPNRSIRTCTYIKDNISFKQLFYDGDLPCTIFSTDRTTFITVYSEYTADAYTTTKYKLTDKNRTMRIIDMLNWTIPRARKNLIVGGDFNINILENTTSKRRLENWCSEHGLTQVINTPTRVVKNDAGDILSSTCIDLCLVRLPASMAIRPNVSDIGISDHFCISISFGNRHKRSDEKKQIRIKHWHFSLDILEQARNNPIILDERKDSKDIQSVAKELTSWFQYFNALATTSRTVKVNNSDVPKLVHFGFETHERTIFD